MIGTLERDLRFAGFAVLEDLDCHDAALLRAEWHFLEENEVTALMLDREWIGPEAILGRNQVAQSFKPEVQFALVGKVIGHLPLIPPVQGAPACGCHI